MSNTTTLSGNLTRDPEIRYTRGSGRASGVCLEPARGGDQWRGAACRWRRGAFYRIARSASPIAARPQVNRNVNDGSGSGFTIA